MKKRLIKGKRIDPDWHCWAWRRADGTYYPETWTTRPDKAFTVSVLDRAFGPGEWVRVHVVLVEEAK